MKSVLLYLTLFLWITFPGVAQISIINTDLPSAGNIFVKSNGLIAPAIDPIPTGPAHTWDFSMLQWTSQTADTFVTVASTGITYSFIFADVAFNQNRANQAVKGGTLPAIPVGGISISDVVSFFYKSSTVYRQSGYGASINGIGVPIPFDNKDVIYNLPLNYQDTDTSFSDFQLAIPGLGYYGHEQVRISEVDGWGTLITPYGTFDALRIRSHITPHDTVFLDTLGIGFGFSLPPTVEYKWLGTAKGIPLLQINTSVPPFGNETVTSIVYLDSVRVTGLEPNSGTSASLSVYPNPSNGQFILDIATTTVETGKVSLFSIDGKKVADLWQGTLYEGTNKVVVNTNAYHLAEGFYILEAIINDVPYRERVVITREE